MNKKPVSGVDEYLARVPEPARTTLTKIRAMIRAAVPKEATEGISYGMPAFKHEGWLIGYAAFTNHCSLFPGAEVLAEFADELAPYASSKGTLKFALDKPMPAALVKKVVKARLAANAAKKAAKKP